jgi:hypothetical protein
MKPYHEPKLSALGMNAVRSEESSIVFGFIFFESKIDNYTDRNEYVVGIMKKLEMKLLWTKQVMTMENWYL